MVDRGAPRWRAAMEVLDRLAPVDDEAVAVRDGLSLLVRRGPVVVRVRPRADEPIARREVEVAALLTDTGVPHTVRCDPVGQPWLVGASVVTAWRWEEAERPATPEDLGLLARALVERTAGGVAHGVARFDPLSAVRHAVAHLPVGDAQGDAIRARAHHLGRAWAEAADADPWGTVVVHGDLHRDNVVVGPEGPLLTDLELAGAGPPSYDAAPAVVAVTRYGAGDDTVDQFLAALGHDPRGWSGFAVCVAVYELWVTAWTVGVRDRSTALGEEAALRLASLDDGTGSSWTLL